MERTNAKNSKKICGLVVSAFLTVITGYFLLRQLPPGAVLSQWADFPFYAYGIGLGLTAIFIWLRAMRFKTISAASLPAWRLFPPAASYSLTSRIFPGGTADLLLPFYLRPYGIGTGESLVVAFASRWFDLAGAILLGFLLGGWLFGGALAIPPLALAIGIAGVSAVGVLALPGPRQWGLDALGRIKLPSLQFLIAEVIRSLQLLQKLSPGRLVGLAAVTICMKLLTSGIYYVLATGLAVEISFPKLFFASVLTSLFLAFPLQGVGGLGTEEAWWTASLRMVGMHIPQAILLGLTFHLLNILFVAILGVVPLLGRIFSSSLLAKGEPQ